MEEGEAMGRRGAMEGRGLWKGREELREGGSVGGRTMGGRELWEGGLCRRENDTNSSNHLHT